MKRQGVAEESAETLKNLEKLLERFSHNGAKPEVYYQRLCEKLEAFFQIKGLHQTDVAVDETVDRLSKLIGDRCESVDEIYRLAYKIAGFVYHEFLREDVKENKAFEVLQQFHDEKSPEQREDKDLIVLQRACLNRLEKSDRELLLDYYDENAVPSVEEHRLQIAEELGITRGNLRVKVSRLCQKLVKMMESKNRK